jgi:hypothetical protein
MGSCMDGWRFDGRIGKDIGMIVGLWDEVGKGKRFASRACIDYI